jgi:hypothetical protein
MFKPTVCLQSTHHLNLAKAVLLTHCSFIKKEPTRIQSTTILVQVVE